MKEKEDFTVWHDYQKWMLDVPQNLGREAIYQAITERTPHMVRHSGTLRVFEESGINLLLDQLIEIQHNEAFDLLLDEQEVGFGL